MHLFGSGTQALTAVIEECVSRRSGIEAPEVILPAYGCPDLVSACVGAGAIPRLVDVAANRWGYDPARLSGALGPRTVAIVAVDLLGIGDDAEALQCSAKTVGAALVRDSAQHLPREPGAWIGDYQIVSFGRGKPLNLLRGGAAIGPLRHEAPQPLPFRQRILGTRLAALLFNIVTQPGIYPWLLRLPGTDVGETTYHSPQQPMRLPDEVWKQLDSALTCYKTCRSYSIISYLPFLNGWLAQRIQPLRVNVGDVLNEEPLRLAMLAPDKSTRDRIVDTLSAEGLGATALYRRALNRIDSVPEFVRLQGPFPNADLLADRLFTLPTHRQVDSYVVERIDRRLRAILPSIG